MRFGLPSNDSPPVLDANSYTELRKTVDDIVYEVDCSLITVKPGADVDIGVVDSRTAPRDWLLTMDRC